MAEERTGAGEADVSESDASEERGKPGRRPWVARHPFATGGVVLALVAAGAMLYAPAKGAWLALSVCDGRVAKGDLWEAVGGVDKSDVHMSYERSDKRLGVIECGLRDDRESHRGVRLRAYTADEVATDELIPRLESLSSVAREGHNRVHTYDHPRAGMSDWVLPAATPGVMTDAGETALLVRECPDLGETLEGAPRRMVVTAGGGVEPDLLHRMAVDMSNSASGELGCGAKELPAPAAGSASAAKPVSLKKAVEGRCGWLAKAVLRDDPSGSAWRVLDEAHEGASIQRCSLMTGPEYAKSVATFVAWSGGWNESTVRLSFDHHAEGTERTTQLPFAKEGSGLAKVRCAGEEVNFTARLVPRAPVQLHPLLAEFTRYQTEGRADCQEPRLPSAKPTDPEKRPGSQGERE